ERCRVRTASARRRSIARFFAVAISHAWGRAGTPRPGHVSTARSTASWRASSARSKSRNRLANAASSRPRSSSLTALRIRTAASGSVSISSRRPGGSRYGTSHPGALLRPGDRLVDVRRLDDVAAADEVVRFGGGTGGDDGLTVGFADADSELGTVEGEPADDDPGLGDLLVEGHELARVRASGLSAVGVPAAAHEQTCVFHVCLPVVSGVTPGGLTPS